MANRFGGALAARPLQFIWIADCSGSMKKERGREEEEERGRSSFLNQ